MKVSKGPHKGHKVNSYVLYLLIITAAVMMCFALLRVRKKNNSSSSDPAHLDACEYNVDSCTAERRSHDEYLRMVEANYMAGGGGLVY